MNATQFIRQQVAEAEGLSDATMAGVTDEQFNWLPPGTMNPIKSTLLHTVGGEDLFFQLIIQAGRRCGLLAGGLAELVWPKHPAAARAGKRPGTRRWRWPPCWHMPQPCVTPPMSTWHRLTEDELDRRVDFFGRESSVADVLARFVSHTACHAGEIAAVKGMQGLQGCHSEISRCKNAGHLESSHL